jgi:hypothetical protein
VPRRDTSSIHIGTSANAVAEPQFQGMRDRMLAIAVGLLALVVIAGCGGRNLPRESPKAAVRVVLGEIERGQGPAVCAALSPDAVSQLRQNAMSSAVGHLNVPVHRAWLDTILRLGRTCVGAVTLVRQNLGQAGIRRLERQLVARSTRVVVAHGLASIAVAGDGAQDWGLLASHGHWQIVIVNALAAT